MSVIKFIVSQQGYISACHEFECYMCFQICTQDWKARLILLMCAPPDMSAKNTTTRAVNAPSPAAPLCQKLYMTFLKAVFSHSNAILNLSLHNLKVQLSNDAQSSLVSQVPLNTLILPCVAFKRSRRLILGSCIRIALRNYTEILIDKNEIWQDCQQKTNFRFLSSEALARIRPAVNTIKLFQRSLLIEHAGY